MSDLIERQAAIDALGEEPEVWSGNDEYEQGLNNQWHYDVNALKDLPSADAIPIEWIKKRIENWADYGTQYLAIVEMLEDWEEENGLDK